MMPIYTFSWSPSTSYKCLFSVVLLFIKQKKCIFPSPGIPIINSGCQWIHTHTDEGKERMRMYHKYMEQHLTKKHRPRTFRHKTVLCHFFIFSRRHSVSSNTKHKMAYNLHTTKLRSVCAFASPVCQVFPHNNTICLHTIANHHKGIYYLFFIILLLACSEWKRGSDKQWKQQKEKERKKMSEQRKSSSATFSQ